MLRRLLICAIAAAMPAPGIAFEQPTPPPEIINFCQTPEARSPLSRCLITETVALETLRAAEDKFIGPAVRPVVEACQEVNGTELATWLCFREAVVDAVKSAELIGKEAIQDECLRGVAVGDGLWDQVEYHFFYLARGYDETNYSVFDIPFKPYPGCDQVEISDLERIIINLAPEKLGVMQANGLDELVLGDEDTLSQEDRGKYCRALQAIRKHVPDLPSEVAGKDLKSPLELLEVLPDDYKRDVLPVSEIDGSYILFTGVWFRKVLADHHPEQAAAQVENLQDATHAAYVEAVLIDHARFCS